MKGTKGEEIFLVTENKIGKLEEVAQKIKEKGVNIKAISAYAIEDKAFFRLITSENNVAKEALKDLGEIETKEVVIVEMPDEVGKLHELAYRLKEAEVDLEYIYGTTFEPSKPTIIVFSSNNNNKALEIISS
jgi:hypothetical protein